MDGVQSKDIMFTVFKAVLSEESISHTLSILFDIVVHVVFALKGQYLCVNR